MKLGRQLFIAISLLMMVLFVALAVASVRGTQAYLQEQLGSHAQETASSLAHPLSQALGRGDLQLAATQVASLFDRGYFQRMAVIGIDGRVVVDRELPERVEGVPGWFSGLFALEAAPGEAFIASGWRQLGKVVVIPQPTYAYQYLWRNLLDTAAWMALAYGLALLLTHGLLRMILKPLGQIEETALEIQQKRFPQIPAVRGLVALELKRVVGAMNNMSRRIGEILDAESARAETYRKAAYQDELTGLDNRRSFELRFEQLLNGAVPFADGLLIGIEVNNLKEFNTEASYKQGDAYLATLADAARQALGERGSVLCRTGGSSFAFVALGCDTAQAGKLARQLQAAVADAVAGCEGSGEISFSIGAVVFRAGEQRSAVMSRLDLAIESARQSGRNAVHFVPEIAAAGGGIGSLAWRELIRNALSEKRWALVAQPVVSLGSGEVIHQEIMTRLLGSDGNQVPASTFIPMALRHRLMADIDRALLSLVLTMLEARVAEGAAPSLAVNISVQSLDDADLMHWLGSRLAQLAGVARHLSFELPEYGCASSGDPVRRFAALVRSHGARFGIDHFGLAPGSLQLLRELPPDYIKLDAGLVAEAPASESARSLLRSIVALADSLEVEVIAQGVETAAQVELLVSDRVSGGQGFHFGKPSAEAV